MNVSDVTIGGLDRVQRKIEDVYVINAPDYAIYRTERRVMVHLADDLEKRRRQQEVLTTLNPIRGEINGLIDGWRAGRTHDKQALTCLFDRRIADSLALALEGDAAAAETMLRSTLEEIGEERQSRGRIEHLLHGAITAAGFAVLALLLAFLGTGINYNYFNDELNVLLFAAGAGAIGAFVSIAIAVQERTIATDLQSRDNITDAIVRVSVGAIGAVLLVAMLRADFIDLEIGDVDLGGRERQQATENTQGPATERPAGPVTAALEDRIVAGGNDARFNTAGPVTNAQAGVLNEVVAQQPDPSAGGGDGVGVDGSPGATTGKREPEPDPSRGLALLVIAFFAGFAERFVKQLASRIRFIDTASPPGGGPAESGGRASRDGRTSSGGSGGGTGHGGGSPTPARRRPVDDSENMTDEQPESEGAGEEHAETTETIEGAGQADVAGRQGDG